PWKAEVVFRSIMEPVRPSTREVSSSFAFYNAISFGVSEMVEELQRERDRAKDQTQTQTQPQTQPPLSPPQARPQPIQQSATKSPPKATPSQAQPQQQSATKLPPQQRFFAGLKYDGNKYGVRQGGGIYIGGERRRGDTSPMELTRRERGIAASQWVWGAGA